MSENTFIKISDLKTGHYLGCLAFFLSVCSFLY